MKDADLIELAARCEAATGPDRFIDAAIMVALDIRPQWLRGAAGGMWFSTKPKDLLSSGEPVVRWCREGGRKTCGNPPADKPLAYTASIDAAMTLVPEGDGIGFTFGDGPWAGPFARIWLVSAESALAGDNPIVWEADANAATLALAITAAALRARLSNTERAG